MKFSKPFLIVLLVFSSIIQAAPNFERISKSIVSVRLVSKVNPHQQQRLGTGFIISKDGFIVTNSHVINSYYKNKHETHILIKMENGNAHVARIIGDDPETDIALLRINVKFKDFLMISTSKPQLGDEVFALGYPLGLELTLTRGLVSANDRIVNNIITPFIQSDVVINKGNSGGPLLDSHGRVVGITSLLIGTNAAKVYMGYSYAIQIKTVTHVVREMVKHGKYTRSTLGVSVVDAPLIINNKEHMFTYQKGAKIQKILKSDYEPLNELEVGDIILGLNGEEVNTPNDVSSILLHVKPNDPINILLSTNLQCVTKTIKLKEYVQQSKLKVSLPTDIII